MLQALSSELLKWCDSLVNQFQKTQKELQKEEEELENCTDPHELWLKYCEKHHIRLAVTPFSEIIMDLKANGAMSDPIVSGVIADYNNYWEAFSICNRSALTILKHQNKNLLDRFRATATLSQMLSCEYWQIAKQQALHRFQLKYLEPSNVLKRKRKYDAYRPNDREETLIKRRREDELNKLSSALQHIISVVTDRQEYDKAKQRKMLFDSKFEQYQAMTERIIQSIASLPPMLPSPFPFEDFQQCEEDEPFTNLNDLCRQNIDTVKTVVQNETQDEIVSQCRRFILQTVDDLHSEPQEHAKNELTKDQQKCTLYVNLNTRVCQLEWYRELTYLIEELDPFIKENVKAYPDVLEEFGLSWEKFKEEQARFLDSQCRYIEDNVHAVQGHLIECFTLAVMRDAKTFTYAITETVLNIIKRNEPNWREQALQMIPVGLRVTVHQSCDLVAQAEQSLINATRRMIERTKPQFMKDTFETISYLLLDLKSLLNAKDQSVTHVSFNELEQIRQQNFPIPAFSTRPIGETPLSLISVIQRVQKELSSLETKKTNLTKGVRGHATKFGLFYHMLSKPSTQIQQVWKAIPDALCTASWVDINE